MTTSIYDQVFDIANKQFTELRKFFDNTTKVFNWLQTKADEIYKSSEFLSNMVDSIMTGTTVNNDSEPGDYIQRGFNIYFIDSRGERSVYQFSLMPAIDSQFRSSTGFQVPEVKPGILIRTAMRHRNIVIPGSAPVVQTVGIENTVIQLVGLFVGAGDGIRPRPQPEQPDQLDEQQQEPSPQDRLSSALKKFWSLEPKSELNLKTKLDQLNEVINSIGQMIPKSDGGVGSTQSIPGTGEVTAYNVAEIFNREVVQPGTKCIVDIIATANQNAEIKDESTYTDGTKVSEVKKSIYNNKIPFSEYIVGSPVRTEHIRLEVIITSIRLLVAQSDRCYYAIEGYVVNYQQQVRKNPKVILGVDGDIPIEEMLAKPPVEETPDRKTSEPATSETKVSNKPDTPSSSPPTSSSTPTNPTASDTAPKNPESKSFLQYIIDLIPSSIDLPTPAQIREEAIRRKNQYEKQLAAVNSDIWHIEQRRRSFDPKYKTAELEDLKRRRIQLERSIRDMNRIIETNNR